MGLQVYICEGLGLKQVADYWHSVVQINDYQKQRFVETVISAMFNTIQSKKIAVLGFAFKKVRCMRQRLSYLADVAVWPWY